MDEFLSGRPSVATRSACLSVCLPSLDTLLFVSGRPSIARMDLFFARAIKSEEAEISPFGPKMKIGLYLRDYQGVHL